MNVIKLTLLVRIYLVQEQSKQMENLYQIYAITAPVFTPDLIPLLSGLV